MTATSYPTEVEAFIEDELAKLAATEPIRHFPPEEYAARLARLRAAMAGADLDVLVITAPDAMAWLHGYASRVYEWHTSRDFFPATATVVHVEEDPMFFVDTAFHTELVRLSSVVEDFRPIPETGMTGYAGGEQFMRHLIGEMRRQGWTRGRVGLERFSGLPNPGAYAAIDGALLAAGYTTVDATAQVRGARKLKSPLELTVIERAQVAADAGLLALQREGRDGMTELEAWHIFMGGVVAAGGEPSAIHETVCTGAMEGSGHALSSQRVIHRGDHFHADGSAAVARYHARSTRPFHLGEPPAALTRLAEITAGAYDVVVDTAGVGMPFRELNHALREYFRANGVGDDMAFGGGYELGVSFMPDFVGEFLWGVHDMETDAVIEAGLVTNFESVAFISIIDTLVFEETGARFLSTVPREVLVIDA